MVEGAVFRLPKNPSTPLRAVPSPGNPGGTKRVQQDNLPRPAPAARSCSPLKWGQYTFSGGHPAGGRRGKCILSPFIRALRLALQGSTRRRNDATRPSGSFAADHSKARHRCVVAFQNEPPPAGEELLWKLRGHSKMGTVYIFRGAPCGRSSRKNVYCPRLSSPFIRSLRLALLGSTRRRNDATRPSGCFAADYSKARHPCVVAFQNEPPPAGEDLLWKLRGHDGRHQVPRAILSRRSSSAALGASVGKLPGRTSPRGS